MKKTGSQGRSILGFLLFLTKPKTIFTCERNQLSVNIHCFQEISEVQDCLGVRPLAQDFGVTVRV